MVPERVSAHAPEEFYHLGQRFMRHRGAVQVKHSRDAAHASAQSPGASACPAIW